MSDRYGERLRGYTRTSCESSISAKNAFISGSEALLALVAAILRGADQLFAGAPVAV